MSPHPQRLLNTVLRAGLGAGCWCVWALWQGPAVAQTSAPGTPSIYVCEDAQGKRITSDRPIRECLDREQRELSSTGATRRIVPPSLTAEERERLEAQAQQAAIQRAKTSEDRRRDRALLSRYPTQRKHDEERAKQLAQVDAVMASIRLREQDLSKQRAALDLELEFYKSAPERAPVWLQRRLTDNTEQQASQERLLAVQALEKQRIHSRFDDELARLRQLWQPTQPPATR